MYADGVEVLSFESKDIDSNDVFSIGQEFDSSRNGRVPGDYWNGLIDEVKVWNYVLSLEDIDDEYGYRGEVEEVPEISEQFRVMFEDRPVGGIGVNLDCLWADYDDNGIISQGDLAYFSECFANNINDYPQCTWADVDESGIISYGDLVFFAQCFGKETIAPDIEVSLATLKDIYRVGEQIKLTDPPSLIENSFEDNLELVNEDQYFIDNFNTDNQENPNNYFLDGNDELNINDRIESENDFEGYIIEFEDDPVIVEKVDLEERAERNEEIIENSPFLTTISGFRYAALREDDVNEEVKEYVEDLERSNEGVKDRIASELSGELSSRNLFSDFFRTITGNAINDPKLEVVEEFSTTFNGVVVGDLSREEIEKVEDVRGVKRVTPNNKVYASLQDSVPLINADQVWQLDANGDNCIQSGEECLTGKGFSIGIIDTGVDYTHGDLGSCTSEQFLSGDCGKVVGGYDFLNDDNDPMDDNGHGTHVAATAAGDGVLRGVAYEADIYAYKVLSSAGSGSLSGIISAIERSVDLDQDGIPCEENLDNGGIRDYLDVISLSLGGRGNPDDPASKAIDSASECTVAVVAAGNSGPNVKTIGSPGTARKAITVGATDDFDTIASFSSRGLVEWEDEDGNVKYLLKPDVVAPGVDICAAQWNNAFSGSGCLDSEHAAISGTSMATPHVSGAAALLLQKNPDWNPHEVKMALRNTAVDIGEPINAQGYGRVDVSDAVNLENRPGFAELEELGKVSGSIDIIGSAYGENFENYNLYYGEGEDPISFNLIGNFANVIEEDFLLEDFDTLKLNEGIHTLKLELINSFGEISSDRMLFEVDHVNIKNPARDYILKENEILDIIGTAESDDFLYYTLSYGVGENPTEWIEIILNNVPVENGVLFSEFDTSNIPPGIISLKLSVFDRLITSQKQDIVTVYKESPNIQKLGNDLRYNGNIDISNDFVVWAEYILLEGDYYLTPDRVNIYDINSKSISSLNHEYIERFGPQTIIQNDKILWVEQIVNEESYTDILNIYDINNELNEIIIDSENHAVHAGTFDKKFRQNQISNNKVVWEDFYTGDIFVYDLISKVLINLGLDSQFGSRFPVIFEDYIVWNEDNNRNEDIYIHDLNNRQTHSITDNYIFEYSPSILDNKILWGDSNLGILLCELKENLEDVMEWCSNYKPDGGLIQISPSNRDYPRYLLELGVVFFRSTGQGTGDSYFYDFGTNEEYKLFPGSVYDISDDHTKLVYSYREDDDYNIYVYDLINRKEIVITENPKNQVTPRISDSGVVYLQEEFDSDLGIYYSVNFYEFISQCSDNLDNDNDGLIDFPEDLGCVDAQDNDETIIRTEPQSKIVNNKDNDVSGNMKVRMQKYNGNDWVAERVLWDYDEEGETVIPANGLLKLDIGEIRNSQGFDSTPGPYDFRGWNNYDVRADRVGQYRAYVTFEVEGHVFENSWEFEVV